MNCRAFFPTKTPLQVGRWWLQVAMYPPFGPAKHDGVHANRWVTEGKQDPFGLSGDGMKHRHRARAGWVITGEDRRIDRDDHRVTDLNETLHRPATLGKMRTGRDPTGVVCEVDAERIESSGVFANVGTVEIGGGPEDADDILGIDHVFTAFSPVTQ